MSQAPSPVDYSARLADILRTLDAVGLAALSSQSGAAEPPEWSRFPYGFWADSTSRTFRQYPDSTANKARSLWTLQSGPYAIIPKQVTANFTLPDMIGPSTGAGTFTWVLSVTSGGAHTITLPLSEQSPNTVVGHLLQTGTDKATLQAQGSDAIRDPSGSGTTTSLELRTEGDLIVLYTLGQGFWRILDDRRAGVLNLSSAGAVSVWDRVVVCDTTGGGFTATLPDPAKLVGRSILLVKGDASGNVATIATASGTINGAATFALSAAWQSARCTSYGSGWATV